MSRAFDSKRERRPGSSQLRSLKWSDAAQQSYTPGSTRVRIAGEVIVRAEILLESFRRHGVTHVIGVPDNGSRALFELLWHVDDIKVVLVSREGEAFGLATGLLVGGTVPLVLIQNTGLLEAGDAFRGTPFNMHVPLVMLVGYRGYGGHREGPGRVDSAATFLEPTLKAWQIPYTISGDDDIAQHLDDAFEKAAVSSLPAAVVLSAHTE